MPKFSANLSMMFTEYPFLARFDAARACGFDAVEFLFPYAQSADEIGVAVQKNDLQISVFNLPRGDCESGDRGPAALSDRTAFRASIAPALPYAKATGAKRLHIMAGLRHRTRVPRQPISIIFALQPISLPPPVWNY